jgi:hypothetical protein
MTNTCLCKRGFFVLRDCGQPAEKPCERCARPICREHLSQRTEFRLCVECAARDQDLSDPADRDWLYGYRSTYYTGDRYTPIYLGSDTSFSDYDYRSFDSTVGDDQTEGDFGGAGAGGSFMDS